MSVRDEFLEQRRPNAAAHVGLVLLPVLFEQGKRHEVRSLASEVHSTLRDLRHYHCAAKAKPYLQ